MMIKITLSYLSYTCIFSQIRLVNIRSDEIVDGNPKLTLGLVWTIILHFQVRIEINSPGPSVYEISDTMSLIKLGLDYWFYSLEEVRQ